MIAHRIGKPCSTIVPHWDGCVTENVVYPMVNPMVLLIMIPMKNGYFIGNIPYFQTNPDLSLLEGDRKDIKWYQMCHVVPLSSHRKKHVKPLVNSFSPIWPEMGWYNLFWYRVCRIIWQWNSHCPWWVNYAHRDYGQWLFPLSWNWTIAPRPSTWNLRTGSFFNYAMIGNDIIYIYICLPHSAPHQF